MADISSKALTPCNRFQRLFPARTSRVYWPLTRLRNEIDFVANKYLSKNDCDTLIDFGCGAMPYRPLLEPRVAEYIGCDINNSIDGVTLMPEPSSLPFNDRAASVVLSTQVLEHVCDPTRYLAEAYRVLDDNGIFILTTHGVWKYHPDPLDYWRWTSAGLKLIVRTAGFEVIHFRGLVGPASLSVQLLQDSLWPRIPRLVKPSFAFLMQTFVIMFDAMCSDPIRDCDASIYVVVGRKTPL